MKARLLLLLALFAAGLGPVGASSRFRSHDEVRRAVELGEIKPLSEILSIVGPKLPGEVTGVEIEHERGRWVYEFRTVDRAGRVFKVHVDARTAEIVHVKEK